MKKFIVATLVIAVCATSQSAFGIQDDAKAAAPATQSNQEKLMTNQAVDGKIRFSFDEQEWQDVVPWFADQAGYSLQPISEWPQGTFTLKDDSEYTVLQALDQLNHALLIRPDEPYTLIRNRNMLVLWKTRDTNFPNDLIETVKVDDLDKRGKYETISCVFDAGELNAEDMFDELKPMISDVNKDFFAVFPSSNQLHIRETGGQLRDIRDLIEASQDRKIGQEISVKPYRLKNQDAETFMMLAGPMLGIPEGQTSRADEDLAISVDPFGDRMFIRGTRKMLTKFDEIAALVDAKQENLDGDVQINVPYVKAYAVFTDPALALNVLDTMLEGLDVKMDQDPATGAIMVLGIKEHHDKVKEYLDAISDVESEDFDIITLQHGDPAAVIVILQNMYRQNGEDAMEGPVLMAQTDLNQILVRGTPQEVANVRKMVQQLDDSSNVVSTGPRTRRRLIEMDENEKADLLPMLDDLLRSEGRANVINIIMPDERRDIRTRIRNSQPSEGLLDVPQLRTAPIRIPQSNFQAQPLQPKKTSLINRQSLRRSANELSFVAGSAFGFNPILLAGFVSPTQDEVGQTSDDVEQKKSANYQPAPQEASEPGAPIEIRATAYGIVLDSKDLDALDDLEDAIFQRLGEESSVQLPQFFALKHRHADEMLNFLQLYFGLEEAGGGGGGAGGMMQGMMNNMMGGGAGDLLGGLLGGGAGGSADATLEGDVKMGVDMRFNMVYVRGATGNDLEEIAILIDTLDRPDPPHEPELIGEFYTIDVNFRDPVKLKELIEIDMGTLLDSGEKSQGGGQNAEAAQMMKLMAAMGGKKGGGASKDLEKEKPKGKLGVDPVTSKLLVTGPHHIYKQVLKRVELLDVPQPPAFVEILDNVGDLNAIGSTLKALLGDKIELIDRSTGEAMDGGSSSAQQNSGTTKKATPSAAQGQDIRRMMEAASRARASQNQGRGGARGGAQTGRGGTQTGRGGGRGR